MRIGIICESNEKFKELVKACLVKEPLALVTIDQEVLMYGSRDDNDFSDFYYIPTQGKARVDGMLLDKLFYDGSLGTNVCDICRDVSARSSIGKCYLSLFEDQDNRPGSRSIISIQDYITKKVERC